MNKKILVVAVLLMVVCVGGAFAWAIGIQGGGGVGGNGGAAITFKLDSTPLVFAADFAASSNYFVFGITGDYWFIEDTIVDTGIGPFGWFLGGGAGIALRIWDDHGPEDDHDGFGLRITGRLPIGLNMMIGAGKVEIEPYIQAVPQIGVWMIDDFGLYWDVNFNAGLRFHF